MKTYGVTQMELTLPWKIPSNTQKQHDKYRKKEQ